MSKSAQAILLAALGVTLLVSGFSGGFIAGHFLPLEKVRSAGLTPALPVATAPAADNATPADLQDLFKPFWEAWQLVHTQFVDQPVDDTLLMQGAIRGMLDSLGDPQSSYMDPDTYEEANADLEGSYEGIGAIVDTTGAYLTVISTFPGLSGRDCRAAFRRSDHRPGQGRHDGSQSRTGATEGQGASRHGCAPDDRARR